MQRRVVVTGIGLISPLGLDAPSSWEALLAGRSAKNGLVVLRARHPTEAHHHVEQAGRLLGLIGRLRIVAIIGPLLRLRRRLVPPLLRLLGAVERTRLRAHHADAGPGHLQHARIIGHFATSRFP